MKLGLFRQIAELNESFDQLIAGLTANREFFDNQKKSLRTKWAYRFQCDFQEKLKDRDDIYLEIRDSEQGRKRKKSVARRHLRNRESGKKLGVKAQESKTAVSPQKGGHRP